MERAKDPWALTGEEKVELADKLKSSGNAFFKKKEYVRAKRSIRRLRYANLGQQNDEIANKIKALKISALELRRVRVETKRLKEVITNCDQVLKIESLNEKVYIAKLTGD